MQIGNLHSTLAMFKSNSASGSWERYCIPLNYASFFRDNLDSYSVGPTGVYHLSVAPFSAVRLLNGLRCFRPSRAQMSPGMVARFLLREVLQNTVVRM
jgi:hypothetical protein